MRRRIRRGCTILTVTSGKCSSFSRTTFPRSRLGTPMLPAALRVVVRQNWSIPVSKPKVLFLCTGNSARSQMAEGYLRHVAGDEFEPLSAGVEPKGLNPLAVEAMNEIGIDISQQRSKNVRKILGQAITYVITACDKAEQQCPIF